MNRRTGKRNDRFDPCLPFWLTAKPPVIGCPAFIARDGSRDVSQTRDFGVLFAHADVVPLPMEQLRWVLFTNLRISRNRTLSSSKCAFHGNACVYAPSLFTREKIDQVEPVVFYPLLLDQSGNRNGENGKQSKGILPLHGSTNQFDFSSTVRTVNFRHSFCWS